MSITGIIPPLKPNIDGTNTYDHAIDLVDSTKPPAGQTLPSADSQSELDPLTRRTTEGTVGKRWTKGALREELARRKYLKYQEGNDSGNEQYNGVSDNGENGQGTSETTQGKLEQDLTRKGRLRDRIPFRSGKKGAKARKQQDYEVDILYENQRGAFLCGIPLYSAKSLLNFDPSPWQTSGFKDSPVNITNAQLPDPSWTWVWKSWYVDMSHDVDEEGWEYSFSFRQGFAWHGNHPWFHSFVRRRRWLRMRVKAKPGQRSNGFINDAHMLNPDYFTIHAKRDRSRGSSVKGSTNNRSSYLGSRPVDSGSDQEDEEIGNILALMKALRKTTVDRKKIEAINNFLEHADDDIYYLPEYIDEIMSMFMYQTSVRQLLARLKNIFDSTASHRQEHIEQNNPEDDREKRRLDSLLAAMSAADDHVKDLEYWSDVQRVNRNGGTNDKQGEGHGIGPSQDGLHVPDISMDDGHSDHSETEIRGIPKDADVGGDYGIQWNLPEDHLRHDEEDKSKNKGKEKV